MSGTSADGIDAALVEITGPADRPQVTLLAFHTAPLPEPVKHRIWSLPDDRSANLCELNFLLGEAFAEAAHQVIAVAQLKPSDVDLIGSHGQTARHQPPGEDQGLIPSTLQIGEAAVIAERTGLPVISDFRVADMAAGGHGAPLIPLADFLLFRQPGSVIALLNLGGIANITIVPDELEGVRAFDIGPANMAMDAVARYATQGAKSYDDGGRIAQAGTVDGTLLDDLLRHPFLSERPPKSTGREMFGRDFVYPLIDRFRQRLPDLMATLAQLTVESIARAIEQFVRPTVQPDRVWVSGGGLHNKELIERLRWRLAPISLAPIPLFDPDAKEAVGFALLANETLFARPGNVVGATGARGPRILGKIALPSVTVSI
jgi:anhydro-N-acetylmuramic acid kinase